VPALDPLITSADLDTYGYTLPGTVDEDAMIARASSRLRRRVRQDITAGTTTALRLDGPGPWLLPQRPVTAVTAVVNSGGDTLATTDWCLRGPFLSVHSWAWNRCTDGYVTVTYAHGFDPCRMG
jgi:hypothetical protein